MNQIVFIQAQCESTAPQQRTQLQEFRYNKSDLELCKVN